MNCAVSGGAGWKVRAIRAVRIAAILGALAVGAFLSRGQATSASDAAGSAASATSAAFTFRRGYSLQMGNGRTWLCYGWANGAYHCTQWWRRTGSGRLISGNPRWVPNYAAHAFPAHPTPPPDGTVAGMIIQAFGPYASQALRVARCESGFDPLARNPVAVGSAHASGVFQILDATTWRSTAYASQSPFNAAANIHAAYQIFRRDGYSWREWACKP